MSNFMEYKGFKARIMEAERLMGNYLHQLPPGTALEVYPVDAFLKSPENWVHGPGAYVVPVRSNKGLWFDWTMNSLINTAVIPTVKGCNPITGLQTSGFHMERYENKCPKHGCNFLAERFCPECNYKWPDRNYVSSSGSGYLWIDGFRNSDGSVRQFFFTEDELRDVATHLIGKENTVPAFGFAFYSPKERRPEMSNSIRSFGAIGNGGCWGQGQSLMDLYGQSNDYPLGHTFDGHYIYNSVYYTSGEMPPVSGSPAVYCMTGAMGGDVKCSASNSSSEIKPQSFKMNRKGISKSICKSANYLKPDVYTNQLSEPEHSEHSEPKQVKEVSIGSGAKISQILPIDTYGINSWKDTPDAVMTIYFVFQEKFEELKAGGMRDFSEIPEGMLHGVPVG
jgi:hypothetical protein